MRSNSCSCFIEIPIVLQVRNLFSKSDFYDNLGHHFRRVKTDSNCFEDIYNEKHCNPFDLSKLGPSCHCNSCI